MCLSVCLSDSLSMPLFVTLKLFRISKCISAIVCCLQFFKIQYITVMSSGVHQADVAYGLMIGFEIKDLE